MPNADSTPHLDNPAAFKAALADYHLSPEGADVLKRVRFAPMTGPTSAGRNTIIKKLLETGQYYFIISDTTRPPRINDGVLEQNGREYFFRTEAEMLAEIQHGDFLEAELIHDQQVSGTSIRELNVALDQNNIATTDVDIGGFQRIMQLKPDAAGVMVLPPSFDEWQQRFSGRGVMSPGERTRRLTTAAHIFDIAASGTYHLVLNDTIEHAVAQVRAWAEHGQVDDALQVQARELAKELATKTRASLRD